MIMRNWNSISAYVYCYGHCCCAVTAADVYAVRCFDLFHIPVYSFCVFVCGKEREFVYYHYNFIANPSHSTHTTAAAATTRPQPSSSPSSERRKSLLPQNLVHYYIFCCRFFYTQNFCVVAAAATRAVVLYMCPISCIRDIEHHLSELRYDISLVEFFPALSVFPLVSMLHHSASPGAFFTLARLLFIFYSFHIITMQYNINIKINVTESHLFRKRFSFFPI